MVSLDRRIRNYLGIEGSETETRLILALESHQNFCAGVCSTVERMGITQNGTSGVNLLRLHLVGGSYVGSTNRELVLFVFFIWH